MHGGERGLLNGQMLQRRNHYSKGIISLIYLPILDFMTLDYLKQEKPKPTWPVNMAFMDFAIIITGLTGAGFWKHLSRKYLNWENRIFRLCFVGPMKTGPAH